MSERNQNMKSNKGITMISLITYIIGLTIVIALVATLTSFFYENINIKDINSDTTQYTKFSSVFLEEINNKLKLKISLVLLHKFLKMEVFQYLI